MEKTNMNENMNRTKSLKKIIIYLVGAAGLALVVFLAVHFFKPHQLSGPEWPGYLIDTFNRQLPGTEFKTDLKTAVVKPAGKGRYWVTFKNVTFSTDLTRIVDVLAKSASKVPFKDPNPKDRPILKNDHAVLEESVLLCGPEKDDINLGSIKGMKVEFDSTKSLKEKLHDRQFKVEKGRITIEKITFSDFNINDLIQAGKENPEKEPFDPNTAESPRFDTRVEHVKIESTCITETGESLDILMDMESLKSVKEGIESSDASSFMFSNNVQPKDIEKLLEKGIALTDVSVETGKINVAIKKNGLPYAYGNIDSVSYSQFIKPDKKNEFFKMGFIFGLKKLDLSIPFNPGIELLSKINQIRFGFDIEHADNDAVMAFIRILYNSFIQRKIPDDVALNNLQRQIMQWLFALNKSKAVITYSLSLFHHYFGDFLSNLKIWSLIPPGVDVEMKISQIDTVTSKLKASKLFSPEAIKQWSDFMDRYTIKQKNGDASMIIQLKPEYPMKYFVNDKMFDIKPLNMPR